jgi:hypothetical protein
VRLWTRRLRSSLVLAPFFLINLKGNGLWRHERRGLYRFFSSSEAAIYDGVMLIHDIELPIWLPTSDCAISIAHCAISRYGCAFFTSFYLLLRRRPGGDYDSDLLWKTASFCSLASQIVRVLGIVIVPLLVKVTMLLLWLKLVARVMCYDVKGK